ncbi:MAG: helix-turn-helix domain-containing protein [Thermoplasmatales archaeon]|nr:helix-turn-helix domain-containing protein [Thermoplasmatales archaeon]
MYDLDTLLAVVENPTRRNILKALAREPSYPLQLSRELGVSQQAVIKNLNKLEENGFVFSYKESSDIGPMRTVYDVKDGFSLTVDLRSGLFSATLSLPEDTDRPEQAESERPGPSECLDIITEINGKIRELDRERRALVNRKDALISAAMDRLADWGYEWRCIAHYVLNHPDGTAREASADLGMPVEAVEWVVGKIRNGKE